MRLYLVQHGQAKSDREDPDRHLTDRGLRDIASLADFLRPLALGIGTIWHSGKARAAQTATLLTPVLGGKGEIVQHDRLAPNDAPDPVAGEVAARQSDLMIVGHMPFLGRLAGLLISASAQTGPVTFQQGGLVCLERDEADSWSVCWMVVPELLARRP